MSRLRSILTARWFLSLLGVAGIIVLICFLGPLIGIGGGQPLGTAASRLIFGSVMMLGWGTVTYVVRARAYALNEKMISGLSGKGEGGRGGKDEGHGGAAAGAAEVAQLRQRLEEALRQLRKLRGTDRRGKRYLYELPWYILIGPPGSGKTTALTNCGLKFPLTERLGKAPLRGVGGTRNCDWFLTDEAVLVDTAGRYVTQDSDEQADQKAWLGFLDLLKQFRPRQPINGALVAISLSDLVMLPEPARLAHARAVRNRLNELQERFKIRFPIYVLFTKADLVAGFVETFETLSREGRDQVWGMTLPLDGGGDSDPVVSTFYDEFRLLLERLDEQMIEREQQEPDLIRRGMIFGLPTQMVALSEVAREFLDEIFLASRYEQRLLLRGAYFTSGTQEGTPIDRLMAAIAQRFGVERQRVSAFSGSGRSYFLGRLLREVVFGEAGLVNFDRRVERRRRIIRWTAYTVALLVTVGACTAWTVSYLENRKLETDMHAAISAAQAEATRIDAAVLRDGDLARAAPVLDRLRRLPRGYETASAPVPLAMTFGLYQGDRIGSQEIAAYHRGLNLILLPRLLWRLQQQLAANMANTAYLYEALKIYLMLGGQHAIDRAAITQWMTLDWEAAFPGTDQLPLRADLRAHLATLLQEPLDSYPLDGPLVAQVRQALQQFPLAGRAYLLLKEQATVTAQATTPPFTDWRISDHAGPAADRVLVVPSGKMLSAGVPGLYTRAGFYHFFLPSLPDAVKAVEQDSWVLAASDAASSEASRAVVANGVLSLYYDDYARYWEGIVADIAVQPLRTSIQSAEILNIISGVNSPLRLVWQSIARETQLTQSPDAKPAPAVQTAPPDISRIPAVLAPAAEAAQPVYGRPVEDRFRAFRDFVQGSGGGGITALDDMLHNLSDLYQQVNQLAAVPPGATAQAANTGEATAAARKLEAAAAAYPPAVAAIARAIAATSTGVAAGGAHIQISNDWKAKVLPLCIQALDGRYPFVRSSSNDVAPDDFARLFAPNGLIDNFFTTALRPFVDTAHDPWRPQPAEYGGIGLASDVVVQFQRAARIRDTYFGTSNVPSVRFDVTPVSIDSGTTKVVLNVEGQEITFDGTSGHPSVVQWPGPSGVRQSTLTFELTDKTSTAISRNGAWSWFRLLDAGQLENLGRRDHWQVTFNVGAHSAVFELHTGSVMNPLALHDVSEFRCPRGL